MVDRTQNRVTWDEGELVVVELILVQEVRVREARQHEVPGGLPHLHACTAPSFLARCRALDAVEHMRTPNNGSNQLPEGGASAPEWIAARC